MPASWRRVRRRALLRVGQQPVDLWDDVPLEAADDLFAVGLPAEHGGNRDNARCGLEMFTLQLADVVGDESCPPEVNKLGRTIGRRCSQITNWHLSKVTNRCHRSSRQPDQTHQTSSLRVCSSDVNPGSANPDPAQPGAPTAAASQTNIGTSQQSNRSLPTPERCSPRFSNTIRTARSRTSGEYMIGLPMTPLSPN